jgi:hypothetical protein
MTKFAVPTRSFGALTVLLAALSGVGTAAAQTDEQRASARALATEGAAAFNEGRYKDSADLFARAESVMHAPPHLLFLARSYAKNGQIVKARETYMKIVKEQLAPTAPQAFRDAQTSAQDELRTVEPKIAKLTIQVTGAEDAKDLSVTIDGTPIPSVMIGIAQPVDPGDHKVSAIATGKRAQPQSVSLKEGERSALTLKLEVDPSAVAPAAPGTAPVVAAPAGAPPAGPAAPPPAGGTPTSDTGVSSSGSSGMKIAGFTSLGVGVVGLGLGTVFILKAGSKRSDADDLFKTCPDSPSGRICTTDVKGKIEDFDEQADSARTLGIVGFAVGGVGAAVGITLLVLSGSDSSSSSSARDTRLVPVVGPSYAGVAGTF